LKIAKAKERTRARTEERARMPEIDGEAAVLDFSNGFKLFAGLVAVANEDFFEAQLYDLLEENDGGYVSIPMSRVLAEDHELVKPGAVFYWCLYVKPITAIDDETHSNWLIKFRRQSSSNSAVQVILG
jgi:hypothetical protein